MNSNFYKTNFNPSKECNVMREVRLVIKDENKNEFIYFHNIKPNQEIQVKNKIYEPHLLYKYKYQIKEDGKWIDHIPYKPVVEEVQDTNGIKYLYFPHERSNKLIVIFQGIKNIDRKSYYNYIKTLANVNASRLYIKDDYGTDEATHSSYYLGENKTFTIAENVHNLIEKFRNSLDLEKKDVICAGSSKGGFAALYFAFKGDYGYAISGGPQIKIGDYLSKGKIDGHEEISILPPILRYLCKEITTENINWANNILFNEIKSSKNEPTLYLHVGKNEPHYKYHVLPLISFLNRYPKRKLHLDLANYHTHKELASHFPDYLVSIVNSIVDQPDKQSLFEKIKSNLKM